MAYKIKNDVTVGNALDAKRLIADVAIGFPTWVTTTAYKVGDTIEQGLKYYKCLILHTAGTFATDLAANRWVEVSVTSTVISDWVASTAYLANQIVKSGNRLLKRTSAGTSGATFDNTEATLWTLLSNDVISSWIPSLYYYAGEILTDGNVTFRRTNSGTSGATLNAAEWFQYQYISQKSIPAFLGNTAYIQGMKVYSPLPQQTLLVLETNSHTTAATFTFAESLNWTFVSPALYYIPIPTAFYQIGDFALNPTNQTILMRNTADHTFSTWTAGEAANWTLISQGIINTWAASTIYLEGTKALFQGGIYQRIATGASGASFNEAEATNWTLIGGQRYVSIPNGAYTILENDDLIDLPAGAAYTITIPAARVNPVIKFSTASLSATPPTIATSGGETIVNPSTYASVSSFVMPGTTGLASSITFQKVGTSWRFIA